MAAKSTAAKKPVAKTAAKSTKKPAAKPAAKSTKAKTGAAKTSKKK